MKIEEHIPLLEEILGEWKTEIGDDFTGYRNHVYRMINFCFAQQSFSDDDRKKIIIAGCFHDLGIWSNQTFDYLPPSVSRAEDYLLKNKLDKSIPEVKLMIETHHKLREYSESQGNLVEVFRKGDLVDFSLGFKNADYLKLISEMSANIFQMRVFTNVYCVWQPTGRFSIR